MGGKLKQRRDTAAKSGALFRPSSAGWQKWSEDAAGVWALQGEAVDLSELAPVAGSLIAVPVRRAFSLAVWVPGEDPGIFRDLVHTQLEMRGLAGRTLEDTAFTWREIAREESEVLLHVIVLPVHLASRYWHGDVTDYAVSPDCLPLPPDAVTVWREEGAWVAAVTRGEKLLHFQSLNEPEADGAMALEIRMMLAPLEAGNMVVVQPSLVLYHEAGQNPDLSAFGWPEAKLESLPPPVRPARALECVPLPVREMQVRKLQGARRQRFAFAAAAIYLALVLLLAGQTLWLHWKARRLQSEIETDAPAVAATREAMQRWQAMQPALEPATYPLEVLYQTARLLPQDGVRLTLFDMDLNRIAIQGEASTLAAALKFADDLKKSAELRDFYDWSAEAPKQLPNGSTRFQINGERRGSSTAEKNDESADI